MNLDFSVRTRQYEKRLTGKQLLSRIKTSLVFILALLIRYNKKGGGSVDCRMNCVRI